jgi:DNA-directed RNA polymerase specialized sigma24 family protein
VTSEAKWALTGEGLRRLLERLGSGPEESGPAYERLRLRLTDYFDWRGVSGPEAAADETLDRVARRLSEGEEVRQLRSYAYGVARHVLQERLREQAREEQAAESVRPSPGGRSAEEQERRLDCLVGCLAELTGEERELAIAYYRTSGPSPVQDRRGLAGRLGLSAGALRTRAHRLRHRLEGCLHACLQGREGR